MPKKVGRPGATSRQAILMAAETLVKDGGEAALSFRKLAAKLEVSAPSIYSYFDSKQALLAALVADMLDITEMAKDACGEPSAQLAILLNNMRQQILQKSEFIALFNSALPAQKMIEIIALLALSIKSAGIAEDKAARHAQSLIWMVLGFTLFEINAGQHQVVEQFNNISPDIQNTLQHLDIDDHDRLWQETLERNLKGIFASS